MDIVLMLIALAVFYLIPELLKRRRQDEYKYPEIPDRVPPPGPVSPPARVKPASVLPAAAIIGSAPAVPPVVPASTIAAADSGPAWQGGFDSAAVRDGLIYAEILSPPKALRHLRHGRRG